MMIIAFYVPLITELVDKNKRFSRSGVYDDPKLFQIRVSIIQVMNGACDSGRL